MGTAILLSYYAASSGNFLPTFRDKLSAHFQGSRFLKMGPIVFSESLIRNYHYSLRNNAEDRCSLIRMQTGSTEVFYNDIKRISNKRTLS